jgi:O-acetyl-ADP-ribose deacetylase
MPAKIYFLKGDITETAVDAVVNPANTDLTFDAGIAGAILRKGGPRIQEECDLIGHVALGETAVTTAGSLKALYVVHAAVIRPDEKATAHSVRLATHNALLRTEEKAFRSIAFPALGTGAAGFPMEECAHVMIREVLDHLKSRSTLEKVYFVLFDEAALAVFEETYEKMTPRPPAKVS